MSKLVATLMLAVACWSALAQTKLNKELVCDETDEVFKYVQDRYQEQPVWLGATEKTMTMLLQNAKTGTWTILQFNDKLACILGSGKSGKLVAKPNYM
jgi:hypothetical protein